MNFALKSYMSWIWWNCRAKRLRIYHH